MKLYNLYVLGTFEMNTHLMFTLSSFFKKYVILTKRSVVFVNLTK